MKFELHLSTKNGLAIVVGFCVVGLAVIPLKVEASHLAWLRWQVAIFALALIGVAALVAQAFIQSREDHERDERERQRDERQDSIDTKLADLSTQLLSATPKPSITETETVELESLPPGSTPEEPDIDGEVYRLVMSPRSVAWPIVRDVFKLKGRPEDAAVDTDIMVEMYLVNKSPDKTQYVKDMRLSAEVSGKRVEFKRQNDLLADPFADQNFEYGLEEKNVSGVQPLKRLFDTLPLVLQPRQPAEGWVRFMATEINADRIVEGTITLTVVDSLGKEYQISRVGTDKQRRGEIALRRLAS